MLRFTFVFLALCSSFIAVNGNSEDERPGGTWPKDWPQGLEHLRAQSISVFRNAKHATEEHRIPFPERESFEAAWPHFLELLSKNHSRLVLLRPREGEAERFVGVVVRCPVTPVTASNDSEVHEWDRTVVSLFVDGEVVDLNRIRLPNDTKINDERFPSEKESQ